MAIPTEHLSFSSVRVSKGDWLTAAAIDFSQAPPSDAEPLGYCKKPLLSTEVFLTERWHIEHC